MDILLQIILRSLETGAIYALASLGIIIVFRTNFVINFAQGTMGMFGAYIVTILFVKLSLPLALCILLGIIAGVIIGWLVDFIVIRRTKKVSALGKEIITLGMMMVFLGLAPVLFGTETMSLPKLITSGNINIGNASVSFNSLFNIIFGLVVTIALFLILQKTKLGLAIRTTASNEKTAKLMGVPTKTVTLFAWVVAMVLGTLAGVMIAPSTSVSTSLMNTVQVCAFFACVLGGFQTFYGPVIGAYIIALANNLATYYVSSVWGQQIVYILIILFLVIKPIGIFGKQVTKKV